VARPLGQGPRDRARGFAGVGYRRVHDRVDRFQEQVEAGQVHVPDRAHLPADVVPPDETVEAAAAGVGPDHQQSRVVAPCGEAGEPPDDGARLLGPGDVAEVPDQERIGGELEAFSRLCPRDAGDVGRRAAGVVRDDRDRDAGRDLAHLVGGVVVVHDDRARAAGQPPVERPQELLEVGYDVGGVKGSEALAQLGADLVADDSLIAAHVAARRSPVHPVDQVVHGEVVEHGDAGTALRLFEHIEMRGVVAEVIDDGVVAGGARRELGRVEHADMGRCERRAASPSRADLRAHHIDVSHLGDQREQLERVVTDARRHRGERREPGDAHGGGRS
jgi:hypothetical protein